jgi:hypothetical protein
LKIVDECALAQSRPGPSNFVSVANATFCNSPLP